LHISDLTLTLLIFFTADQKLPINRRPAMLLVNITSNFMNLLPNGIHCILK